jgi:hypothetical protein
LVLIALEQVSPPAFSKEKTQEAHLLNDSEHQVDSQTDTR